MLIRLFFMFMLLHISISKLYKDIIYIKSILTSDLDLNRLSFFKLYLK